MKGHEWSEVETKRLIALRNAGLPYSEIGKLMGLSKGSVLGRAQRLAKGELKDRWNTGVAKHFEPIAEVLTEGPWAAPEDEQRQHHWRYASQGAAKTRAMQQ